MGSPSNAPPKSAIYHHPLTYSVSMASMPTNLARGPSSPEHRRLNRSASEPVTQMQQQQLRPTTVNNASRYKTELCRPFEESGLCKYGDKCQFAHGAAELRNLIRHPKYKTELCRTFHSSGFCPYGPRCHFIHNDTSRSPITNGLQASGNINIPSENNIPSGNINIPSNSINIPLAVESIVNNTRISRVLNNLDFVFKSLNPYSSGDLSPSTSSISGSPSSSSSSNGFPMETEHAASRVSPGPLTAPPFVVAQNSFFGQDFVPFPSMIAGSPLQQKQQPKQQPSSPALAQRLVGNGWQPNALPPMDNLNAAMGELNLRSRNHTSNTAAFPSDHLSKLRLPIFSQLAFPRRQYVGTQ